ncbi:MAG: NAD-dependent epimerase/dehydratase family protein [Nanoarchaeota archaeon]|nr:NAD-dependent epimerase/dehydratase family protein [Nanoarchaeota archaeon]MBU2520539.1 NAD-dependent epimerase/dehydratase family protein [Nanoarchaeota archaeon]
MKILITGGSGFVGKHLINKLKEDSENEIYALDIVDPQIKGVEYVNASILDYEAIKNVLKDLNIDIIYHLAAQISLPFSVENPLKDFELNVQGTVNVLEACREFKIKKIVFISTAAVYGIPTENPVSEDAPKRPSTPYGMSKLSAESYVQLYHKLYGLTYTILRFFNLYGPRGKGVVPIFVSRAMNKDSLTLVGSGDQIRDFLYVDDAVNALHMALKGLDNNDFNVGFGKETTIKQVAEEVNKQISVEISYKEQETKEDLYPIANIEKIKSKGFEPKINLEEGIKRIIEYGQASN